MGRFVVLEGPDGSGKSTQMRLLAQSLQRSGVEPVTTREPGGTQTGDAIRDLMFGPSALPMTPLTQLFLMNAARTELVREVIRPALSQDRLVLSDRYWYSSLAYQSAGDGVDPDVTRSVCRLATDGLEPDLVLLFDMNPEDALTRKANQALNVLDRRPSDFHARARLAYLQMARQEPDRWLAIDASLPINQVAEQVLETVQRLIGAPVTEVGV